MTVWAVEGDFNVATERSNTFELEWPLHSGRIQTFPEVDCAEWFDLATAATKLVTAQTPFLSRFVALTERR